MKECFIKDCHAYNEKEDNNCRETIYISNCLILWNYLWDYHYEKELRGKEK
jgi:hypothetical protein